MPEPAQNIPATNQPINPLDFSPDTIDLPRTSVDISRALKLRLEKNLSYREIASALNIPKSTLFSAIKPFEALFNNPEAIQAFKDNRSSIYNAAEMRMMVALSDDERIEKASLNNVAYAMKQIHDMRRLNDGQSTSNFHLLHDIAPEDREWLTGVAADASRRQIEQMGDGEDE